MDVIDVHLRLRLRLHRLHGQPGESFRPDADDHLGQQLRVLRLQPDGPRIPPRLLVQPPVEDLRDLFVRAVLQQPGEEQVPRFEERQVGFVLDLGGGQQPGRLQIQQRRRDHQELGRLVQVPVRPHRPDVHHELIGDLGERDLGDIQLVLRDQLEEEVEGPLEVGEPNLEDPVVGFSGLVGHIRHSAGFGFGFGFGFGRDDGGRFLVTAAACCCGQAFRRAEQVGTTPHRSRLTSAPVPRTRTCPARPAEPGAPSPAHADDRPNRRRPPQRSHTRS